MKEAKPLQRRQVQRLVAILLRSRPDLVIVKTANHNEKQVLVEILRSAGATVIRCALPCAIMPRTGAGVTAAWPRWLA